MFFSADDDITSATCKKLLKDFEIWKSHSVGDIAPLMSHRTVSFNFQAAISAPFRKKKDDSHNGTLRSVSIGIAWLPRHFLELYNSNRTWEIQQIRKIGVKIKKC